MPEFPFAFQPLRQNLYSPHELLAGFSPERPESYCETIDFLIYQRYVSSGRYAPSDYFMAMMQALHDNSINLAAHNWLASSSAKAIGVMGGHELSRDSSTYERVARLAQELARRGFTLVSGGGPGAMEATHLGALLQYDDDGRLDEALSVLAEAPALPSSIKRVVARDGSVNSDVVAEAHEWMRPAWEVLQSVEKPGESLAIPTWLYGHEPSTLLATRIAKYFQNSIREDSLLAIATHGVVYVEGRAGTLQEIFQDAAQNAYRTFGSFNPMIFFGREYWSRTIPALPALQALLEPQDYERYVLVTDDMEEILSFVMKQEQTETPSERFSRART